MGFLDNSGDIILDAVLTDTGRYRLAKGNGSFKIAKFAFGDDEINYNLYEKNHASGSAYYDLTVLQTPVLEAFTNNTSTMNSKLLSIPKTNLLFLPAMVLNQDVASRCVLAGHENLHLICCTIATEDALRHADQDAAQGAGSNTTFGILKGVRPGVGEQNTAHHFIQVDQGLDTDKISAAFAIDPDLKENQYIVQMDNRLGRLVTDDGNPTPVNFIDDDNVATYYLSGPATYNNGYYVGDLKTMTAPAQNQYIEGADGAMAWSKTPLKGPIGTYCRFKIAVSVALNTSDYLFDTLGKGSTKSITPTGGITTQISVKYIDSTIKVTGATTGNSVDIPVRYVKKIS